MPARNGRFLTLILLAVVALAQAGPVPAHSQSEQTQPEETLPEETQPEQTPPAETLPEETLPAQPQPAETTWVPLANQTALNQIALGCLDPNSTQALGDGRYVVQAGERFGGGTSRYGPWLHAAADFGVQVSLTAGNDDEAALSLYGALQQGELFWQGVKRMDLGLRSGQMVVSILTGESPTPHFRRLFPIAAPSSPAVLGVRKVGGELVFLAGGEELGRIADPGLFASGEVYLGANVAPRNRMVIDALTVEAPEGQAGGVTVMPLLAPQPQSDSSLRAAADARGIRLGASHAGQAAFGDSRHLATLAREFNTVSIIVGLRNVRPASDRWNFCQMDVGVAYARANGMTVFAQTLLYDGGFDGAPQWLIDGSLSPEQVRAHVREYLTTVVGRYRGQVAAWNVQNELVERNGSLRETPLRRILGPDYYADSFRWAHEADPDAKLYYNEDSGEGLGAKSDGVFNLVKGLRDRGAPIHAVGLQMHFDVAATGPSRRNPPVPPADVAANMRRLAELGLAVYITELDSRVGQDPPPARFVEQAQIYADMLRVCLAAPNCGAYITWGVSDRYTGLRISTPGRFAANQPWERPLMFDDDFQPKPAYHAVRDVLVNR